MLGLGLIRIIMIISVLNFNNNEEYHYSYFFSGPMALKIFFIFSGFFMEMVYPKYKDAQSFYISRIVRIYPCYWFAAASEYFVQKFHLNYYYLPIDWKKMRQPIARLIQFSNIFLLGKDDVFFLFQDEKNKIHWITTKEKNILNYYLMVFPSWSLGIFMKFYLLLPILAKMRSRYLFLIFLFSFFMRAYFYSIKKINFDPYNYRFFPFEISFFIIGQLINRFYSKYQYLYDQIDHSYLPVLLISVFMILYDHFFSFLGLQFLPLLMMFFIPYLFHISRNSIIDKKLGNIVYYIYIWQTIVVSIINKILPKALISGSKFLPIEILFSLFFSILFDELIQKYINRKFKPHFVENYLCGNAIKNISNLSNEEYDIRESTQFVTVNNNDKNNNNSFSDGNSDYDSR